MQMIREATPADVDAIAALTAAVRRRLAGWAAQWWRPAERADELHRLWLGHLVDDEQAKVRVVTDHATVVGCAVSAPQGARWVVDDVALDRDERWADVGVELLRAVEERPALTCVPRHHLARRAASEAAHLHHASSLWVRATTPASGAEPEPLDPATALPHAPPHPFEALTDPWAPGALTLAAPGGGALVGSPSLPAPPVYDPGGPVCVVDRITGEPAPLLEQALQVAGARGDVLLAVVASVDDDRVQGDLRALRFERTVDVFTWPAHDRHRRRR